MLPSKEFLLWRKGISSISAAPGPGWRFNPLNGGLRIWHCHSFGVGRNSSLDTFPGLGTPYTSGWSKKKRGKKKKEKKKKEVAESPERGPLRSSSPEMSRVVVLMLVCLRPMCLFKCRYLPYPLRLGFSRSGVCVFVCVSVCVCVCVCSRSGVKVTSYLNLPKTVLLLTLKSCYLGYLSIWGLPPCCVLQESAHLIGILVDLMQIIFRIYFEKCWPRG